MKYHIFELRVKNVIYKLGPSQLCTQLKQSCEKKKGPLLIINNNIIILKMVADYGTKTKTKYVQRK